MRSIGGFEAPRWLSDKSPKAAGSRTSEAIVPGTANGQGPGKWGCIMISLRLALTRREDRRLTKPSVPAKGRRRPWDRLKSL